MKVERRTFISLGAAAVVVIGGGLVWARAARFPPDTTPEGAYLRIAKGVGDGSAPAIFAYLEDRAQHACWSIKDYRKHSSDRVASAFPEPERTRLLELYKASANAEHGRDVFAEIARERGFLSRLRKDLSGIAKVEVSGERATIETTHGTRYAFRRRDNGIWGLTLFTPELVEESERAARDDEMVERAAADYQRGK